MPPHAAISEVAAVAKRIAFIFIDLAPVFSKQYLGVALHYTCNKLQVLNSKIYTNCRALGVRGNIWHTLLGNRALAAESPQIKALFLTLGTVTLSIYSFDSNGRSVPGAGR